MTQKEMITNDKIGSATVFQHEDTVLKTAAQFFAEELIPYLGIDGKVVSSAPTESIVLNLKKFYEDINLIMEDGTWKHFEFQSKNEGIPGLKRFRSYEAVTSYQYGVSITTYVLYSGNIRNPVTSFTEGINTYRIIPIIMKNHNADRLIETLKEYKKWQDNRRVELGDYMQGNDYLFTQENGKRLYPSTFTGWLNKMLREANIDHYSLHSLRHTNITLQIAAGVPIVTVSARAGHARTSTTSDIYAYALRSTDRLAADKLGSIFSDEQKSAESPKPVETDILSDIDEQVVMAEFKRMKSEMQRLGFETMQEYEEYLEFVDMKKTKKKDFEM